MDPCADSGEKPCSSVLLGKFWNQPTWNALQLQVLNVEVTQHLIGSELLPSAGIRAVLVQWG